MTTTERMKRIGSLELKKRIGANLIRGLIASVFIHSAVVSIGLFDWGEKAVVTRIPGKIYPLPPIKPRPEKDQYAPPIKPPKPVLPEVKIVIPTDVDDPIVDDLEKDVPKKGDLFSGKWGVDSDSNEAGGVSSLGGDGSLTDLEPITAGPSNPWDKFVLREIEPVPLSINPIPKFPLIAARAGVTAKVYVWVLVGVDGKVAEWNIVHVTAPGLGFEEAVAEVIGKWQFTPAIQGNSPVEVWVNIPFNFRMKH